MSEAIQLHKLSSSSKVHLYQCFRSIQVGKCTICGALTNYVYGHFREGSRFECPNKSQQWHGPLSRKIDWKNKHPHPQSYKDELQAEIDEVLKQNANSIKNDLEGNPDTSNPILFKGTYYIK